VHSAIAARHRIHEACQLNALVFTAIVVSRPTGSARRLADCMAFGWV